MNISLAAETIFSIAGFDVTNTVFTAVIVTFLVLIFSIFMRKNLSYDNPGKLQSIFEMMLGVLYTMVEDVMEKKYAEKFFGFIFTFFIFILFSNWFALTPIVPSISLEKHSSEIEEEINDELLHTASISTLINKVHAKEGEEVLEKNEVEGEYTNLTEHDSEEFSLWNCIKSKHCYITTSGIKEFHESVHLLRAPTSDLSMAIALALVSVIVTNIIGFVYLKFDYLKKYIAISWPINPINLFVGLLEIISEFGKLISFSFRLFGNIFAGEVLLVVITSISIGVATLPFLMLEIFVGIIQAFVFFILTAVFIGLATTKHH